MKSPVTHFRLPTNSQRVAVMGRTGSGKTVLGAWLLSMSPFDKQPYVMIDYKGDELLNGIDRVREIGLKDKLPTQPGLYIVHPKPKLDDDDMEAWLHKVWNQGHIGLYGDEAYQIPERGAFEGILTQGRSLRIPVISLTQRPSWISRFVFSEADFFAVFHLNDKEDRKKVKRFIHSDADLEGRLDDYHCHWYDVGKDFHCLLSPVPKPETIQEIINSRLTPRKRYG